MFLYDGYITSHKYKLLMVVSSAKHLVIYIWRKWISGSVKFAKPQRRNWKSMCIQSSGKCSCLVQFLYRKRALSVNSFRLRTYLWSLRASVPSCFGMLLTVVTKFATVPLLMELTWTPKETHYLTSSMYQNHS
jgi:hypothetical protein